MVLLLKWFIPYVNSPYVTLPLEGWREAVSVSFDSSQHLIEHLLVFKPQPQTSVKFRSIPIKKLIIVNFTHILPKHVWHKRKLNKTNLIFGDTLKSNEMIYQIPAESDLKTILMLFF